MDEGLDDALDAALDARLRQLIDGYVVGRTMRTPRAQDAWIKARLQEAVRDVKRLVREGSPVSPARRAYLVEQGHLGLLEGARSPQPDEGRGTAPVLRLVE